MNNQEAKWTVDQIIEYLLEPNRAIEFFYERRIANITSIELFERYEADDGRKGIIFKVKEAGNDAFSGVMIDIKKGEPSIDQVYDAVYGIGKECSRRVILYTGEHNDDDGWNPGADDIAVRSLIEAMNEYPLKLYLEKFGDDGNSLELNESDVHGEHDQKFLIADLPTPERFRAEEFWSVYFDWHNFNWYESWNAFKGGIREASDWGHKLYTDPNFAEIPVFWTESGITYVVKQIDESDDFLQKIWVPNQDELKRMYHGRVEFEYQPEKLPKIVIKYTDRPVNWLVAATPTERFEFARQLHKDCHGLRWFLSEATQEMDNLKVA
jgi:hypothetical protein